MAKYPEFVKDDYFKIDVECHLSGEANKKYFNYFPEYRKWVYGTAETARAFNAVPHHVTKDWKEPPVTKAEKSELAEEDQLIVYLDRYGVDMACILPESMMETTGYSTKWSTNGYRTAQRRPLYQAGHERCPLGVGLPGSGEEL